MRYKYLIFDVDGTLLDFGNAYADAQRAIAEKLGVAYTADYVSLDDKLGWKGWGEFGLDNVEREDIQTHYHEYYYAYLRQHFTYLLEALRLQNDPAELVDHYLETVAASCEFVEEDTWSVYRELAATHKMVLATNGVSRVQRPRLEVFVPVTDAVFISEELGVIKPAKAFFDKMLADLACAPEDCLMIGDSLSSDILGAKNAGMGTCWYNRKGKKAPTDILPDHIMESIRELPAICK